VWATTAPLAPWIAALALRHGWRAIAAANPGMPDGGLVGESKFDILTTLPRRWTVPSARIESGALETRLRAVAAFWEQPAVAFPLILKPDVGQRGSGVRKVSSMAEAAAYLRDAAYPVVAQPWHPGPFEAGIFYWRHPEAERGQIFSITDKVFPEISGDGVRSSRRWSAHPRFARQAPVFRDDMPPCVGACWHPANDSRWARSATTARARCSGAGRTSGPRRSMPVSTTSHAGFGLLHRALRRAIQRPGRFMAGEDLAIIELNGVTAEPTDVYDPDRSVTSAYRSLFEQWRLVFEIGAANRRRGHAGASLGRLLRLALAHLRDGRQFPLSS
jgi:hypothetical protein